MKLLRTLIVGLGAASLVVSAHAAGGSKKAKAPEGGWPFAGPLGELEMDSVQRGYQVYREVCAACHGLELLSYRNLGEKGGPFYDPAYSGTENPMVAQFASEYLVFDPTASNADDDGFRNGRPSDRFRSPYPDEQTARAANNGAYPPDFSVITKARGKGNDGDGASYVYNLIKAYPLGDAAELVYEPERVIPASDNGTPLDTSDDTPERIIPEVYETRIYPARMKTFKDSDDYHFKDTDYLVQPIGQYYNPYMAGDTSANWVGDPRHLPPGGFLAMGPQLVDGRVEYMDGTEATVQQMSYDIAQFLHWAGDPKQTQRKTLGLPTMLYLLLLTVLLWFSYKQIWRKVDH